MIEIDKRRWPIVVFTFRGVVSAEELEDYLRATERILAKGQRYVGVVLADDVKPLDVPLIRRQAAWIKEHEAALREQSLGVALVMSSPMVRGVLRAILWIQPMPQPHMVASSEAEALAWVRELLRGAGVDAPAASCRAPRGRAEEEKAKAKAEGR